MILENFIKGFISKVGVVLSVAIGLALVLTSCSNDGVFTEASTTDATVASGSALLIVNVTKDLPDGIDTRTELTEDDGNLSCVWTANDKILVTDTNGDKKGVLTLVGDAGFSRAQFSGVLSSIDDGDHTLNFFYLGNNVGDPMSVPNPYIFNLHAYEPQYDAESDATLYPKSDLESLSDNDILFASQSVNIANGAGIIDNLNLDRQIAFIHISLKFPDGYRYDNQKITVTGVNFKSSGSLSFATGELTGTEGSITVYNDDFYIPVIPSENFIPEFVVRMGATNNLDNEGAIRLRGSLPSRDFIAGEFVRSSHGKGVEVKMELYIPENTEEWVDLGLPSGNLWRNRNLGAAKESDPGYYLGWGSTDPSMISEDNQAYPQFRPGSLEGYDTEYIIIEDENNPNTMYVAHIQGNINYDAAYKLTDGVGCLPDRNDFTELVINTSIDYVTVNGNECVQLTSNINGNHILIPLAGVKLGYDTYPEYPIMSLWTDSSQYIVDAENINGIWYDYNMATVFTNMVEFYGLGPSDDTNCFAFSAKCFRANVRPIKKTSTVEETLYNTGLTHQLYITNINSSVVEKIRN